MNLPNHQAAINLTAPSVRKGALMSSQLACYAKSSKDVKAGRYVRLSSKKAREGQTGYACPSRGGGSPAERFDLGNVSQVSETQAARSDRT